MNDLHFDSSLQWFCQSIEAALPGTVEHGHVLRDATGRLAFITPHSLEAEQTQKVTATLRDTLRPYVLESRVVLDPHSPGVSFILESTPALDRQVQLERGIVRIKVMDRRVVGMDWLAGPQPGWRSPQPARFVFASLKGGVGRSTALAVAAVHLASKGSNVLVVDLDFEAPGIGNILLRDSEMPKFGALDFHVESGLRSEPLGPEFFRELVAPSSLGDGRGLLEVVPVCGNTTSRHPENMLAKLSRAYLDVASESCSHQTFLTRTQRLVDELCTLRRYDVVLVDSRAGLNESTAAAILGLGAEVLLFGIDTPQTFSTARYLMAHLASFKRQPGDDWLLRVKWIHAKASADAVQQAAFRDRAFDVCSETLYCQAPPADEESDLDAELEFTLNNPDAPHYAWPVLFDGGYLEFDPLAKSNLISAPVYQATFSALLSGIEERMSIDDE